MSKTTSVPGFQGYTYSVCIFSSILYLTGKPCLSSDKPYYYSKVTRFKLDSAHVQLVDHRSIDITFQRFSLFPIFRNSFRLHKKQPIQFSPVSKVHHFPNINHFGVCSTLLWTWTQAAQYTESYLLRKTSHMILQFCNLFPPHYTQLCDKTLPGDPEDLCRGYPWEYATTFCCCIYFLCSKINAEGWIMTVINSWLALLNYR